MLEQSANSQNQKVAEYYAALHNFYDTIFEKSGYYNLGWLPKGSRGDYTEGQKTLVTKVTEPFRKNKPQRLLDVGCGQGSPALQASNDLGARIIGLELLKGQLSICSNKANVDLKFVQGDACRLPFADESFDGIYSLESAFHYADKAAFIRESARVLRPGGLISLADIISVNESENSAGISSMARIAGADNFFTVHQYIAAAKLAGMTLTVNEDITAGITRSFRHTASRTIKYWAKLRRGLPVWKLAGVVGISWVHPLIYRWLPVRYQWMVFQK